MVGFRPVWLMQGTLVQNGFSDSYIQPSTKWVHKYLFPGNPKRRNVKQRLLNIFIMIFILEAFPDAQMLFGYPW